MMKHVFAAVSAVALFFAVAGCGNVDLTPPGPGEHVVEGVVTLPMAGSLPENTEVTVQVADLSRGVGRGEVLGEQTIANPGKPPVPFRIYYRAEDAVLRRGLNLDVRVSIGGKLAYYTASAHPLTSANVNETHLVEAVPVARGGRQ
jgi:uncharacterized lipoprotein YbaY